MSLNRGKEFEEHFKRQFTEQFPNYYLHRLKDQVTGNKFASRNVSDFFAFMPRYTLAIECKSHKGNTFPLTDLRQYDDMVKLLKYENIKPYVLLWYIDHDKIYFIPIKVFTQLKEEGSKSLNIKYITNYPDIVEVPSTKIRKYMKSNFAFLEEL
jgi:penicillin-binding protein-related factor A (putative recombinase)